MFSGPHIWRRLIRSCRSRSLTRNGQRRSLRKLRSGDYLPATVATLEGRMMLSATVYSSTDVPLSIPDQTTILSTVNVLDSVVIDDVNVTLDITHTTDQDLDVFLIAPGGTRVELFTDVGGGGDHFTGTTLDDEAATAITSGAAPFFGTYRPEGSLSDFDGIDAGADGGVWTLEITDDKRRKEGTLNSWSIEITSAAPALPTLAIGDVQLAEGDSGTTAFEFNVTRSGDTTGTSSVDFATADGTAAAGTDYVATNGTVQFLAGETSQTITVQVNGDTDIESDETFTVVLSNPTDATIDDGAGAGTITDDDTTPTISFPDFSDPSNLSLMGSASITTGNLLRLTPSVRDAPAGAYFDVQQFVATPFETSFDFQLGGGHGFAFVIQNFSDTAALTAWRQALGYDGMPNSIAVEFDTGLQSKWGDPNDNHVSVHTRGTAPNSVNHQYSLGVGTPSFDLNDGNVHSAKITYAAGTLTVFVDDFDNPLLAVNLDILDVLDLDSARAWVGFTATATDAGSQDILNWEFTPGIDTTTTISIEESDVLEGDSGVKDIVFSVVRMGDTTGTVSIDWETGDGTATGGADYNTASSQLVFAPGETEKQITISVNGDTGEEAHETFFVDLSLSAGTASIVDGRGVGTILNDDTTIQVSDVTVTEGDATIRFIDKFVASGITNLANPQEPIFGPDSNSDGFPELYVASRDSNMIYRYDGRFGSLLDVFVSPGRGGLHGPSAIAFGPDGNLYVSSVFSDEVHRFSITDGSSLPSPGNSGAVFVSSGSGGLDNPRGLTFGPDGNLYVVSGFSDDILRYDAVTGEFIDAFVQDASGGLNQTLHDIEFGPDGNNDGIADLFVTAPNSRRVFRYDGATGAPLPSAGNSGADFVVADSGGLHGPGTLHFGPDGSLYVQSIDAMPGILRYDGVSGEFLEAYLLEASHGPFATGQFVFGADGNVYSSQGGNGRTENTVARFGVASQAILTVSLSSASGSAVTVDYTTADGTATAGSDYMAVSGTITFAPGETTRTILVSTIDNTDVEGDEAFVVNLSNATGGIIQDSQGTATIEDDDASNDTNALYVYDIRFESKRGGKDWRAVIEIRNDSNANGLADVNDSVRAGVTVTVEFAGQTYTGTTDSNGIFRTSWQRNLSSGNYYANVTDLDLLDYS